MGEVAAIADPPDDGSPYIDGVGWCGDDSEWIGCIARWRAGVWEVLHVESGADRSVVARRLDAAFKLPCWPCRYCALWKEVECRACGGAGVIANG